MSEVLPTAGHRIYKAYHKALDSAINPSTDYWELLQEEEREVWEETARILFEQGGL
jgi:hypothetical protein